MPNAKTILTMDENPVARHPEEYDATLTDAAPPGDDVAEYSHAGPIIPLELFRHIIGHVYNRKTLLSLLLSFKFIHRDVEQKLYYAIRLNTTRSHLLFLETILDPNRPHLARYIHRYFLFHAPARDDNFQILMMRALPMFVNLKYLSFWGVGGIPPAQLLPTEDPSPFQLHTFHWIGGTSQEHLQQFLGTQHALEVLTFVPSIFEPIEFDVDSLRKVWAFKGPLKVIIEILPDRDNITCLQWDPYAHAVDINEIPSFSHIRILSLGIMGTRPPLRTILPLLEHLEILELGSFDVEESADLYKLTRLRILVMSFHSPSGEIHIDHQEAFREMKDLERIDLLCIGKYQAPNPHSVSYERWVGEAQDSVRVRTSEVVWWREVHRH